MRRKTALAGLLLASALLAAFVLRQVLMTIFLALTVVVARPLYSWLVDRGVQRHVASGITTVAVFLAVVVIAAPIGFVLYERRREIETAIESLPSEFTFTLGGIGYTLDTGDAQSFLVEYLADVGIRLVSDLPELGLRLTLFTVIVFGVLLGQRRAVRRSPPSSRGGTTGSTPRSSDARSTPSRRSTCSSSPPGS